jgi:hypothetical protein
MPWRDRPGGRATGRWPITGNRRFRSVAAGGWGLLLASFLLVIGFVNPVRETGSWSDDFAYARMVRHLLETGEYRLDDWAAANLPVQVYLAAGLTKIFGYSLTLLRISTLLLVFAGLVSFYFLLHEHGTGEFEAGLLALTLLASPLVLYLSFTFTTDAQFLSWMLIAVLFYSRGIGRRHFVPMVIGSLAAAAAIGIRQFGVALPAGLVLTWLIGRSRLEQAPLYLAGLVLPTLAGLWQVSLGLTQPSVTRVARLGHTLAYLHRGLPAMLAESVYRLAVLLEYLGLFLLPLPLVLLFPYVQGVRAAGGAGELRRWRGPALMISVSMCLMGLYGLSYYWVNGTIRRPLMPSLGWVLTVDSAVERRLLTVAATTCGALLLVSLCTRYLRSNRWRSLSPGETLLVSSSIVMFVLNVLYVQYNDTYLVVYIPVALIAVAKETPRWPRRWRLAHLLACLPIIVLASLWTRGSLVEEEAYWRTAEEIRLRGVMPSQVAGDLRWSCYHGAFDDWVAEIGGIGGIGKYNATDPRSPLHFHRAFAAFMARRTEAAEYVLLPCCRVPGDRRRVVQTVTYPGMFLEPQILYVVERDSAAQALHD